MSNEEKIALVRVSGRQVEEAYVHLENGGLHMGFTAITQEFSNGSFQKFLVMTFAQSQFGVRTDSSFRIVNFNQLQYLSEMIERAKAAYMSDPEFVNQFQNLGVEVNMIGGLVVEKVFGPGEPVEGTTNLRERVIAHNFRDPETGEIKRTEPWTGVEMYRFVEAQEPHDGGSYDEDPEVDFDAGDYDEKITLQ